MFAGELCASCRTGEISHRPKPVFKTKCVVLLLSKEVFWIFSRWRLEISENYLEKSDERGEDRAEAQLLRFSVHMPLCLLMEDVSRSIWNLSTFVGEKSTKCREQSDIGERVGREGRNWTKLETLVFSFKTVRIKIFNFSQSSWTWLHPFRVKVQKENVFQTQTWRTVTWLWRMVRKLRGMTAGELDVEFMAFWWTDTLDVDNTEGASR